MYLPPEWLLPPVVFTCCVFNHLIEHFGLTPAIAGLHAQNRKVIHPCVVVDTHPSVSGWFSPCEQPANGRSKIFIPPLQHPIYEKEKPRRVGDKRLC